MFKIVSKKSIKDSITSIIIQNETGNKMNQSIKITRIPYEEPYHLNLIFEATNGSSVGQIEIYIIPHESQC